MADLTAELDGIIAAQAADPPDDEHDVEGSSVGFERARVTALLEHATTRLAALDAAVARDAAGVAVGACEACGRPIGEERLAAIPEAVRCVSCARAERPNGPRTR
ncbi:MAG TPA: TraR/DksA C4-type zinc finger protein [Acidimicrobiales bacterium]|nr:TraR/DksA C4-type zinc finger protein [Acidimicrobiales bacterium]